LITNGTVLDMKKDQNSLSLIVSVQNAGNGVFIITIPRALVDATVGDHVDDMFFVLIDGEEVTYNEIQTTSKNRTLSIPFKEADSKIEIIGGHPL